MKKLLALILAISFLAGCATTSTSSSVSKTAAAVSNAVTDAQTLAKEFNAVYAFLVAEKAVPDHLAAATQALAAMDAVAPLVQQGAEALTGDTFNWANFILNSALTVAKVMGFILPLVV